MRNGGKHHTGRGLHVPAPKARPGDHADFSGLALPKAGETARPEFDTPAAQTHGLAYGLIRVLDETGQAIGPWDPHLDPDTLRRGLRAMMLTRQFDERMYNRQRQGKTSFYMKCTGEEAICCAQGMVLRFDDMCFPSYRCQGLLVTRDYPLVAMMNQIFSNSADPMKGRQLPVLYSARAYGFFTESGNVGTQCCQAVGWAMASAYKGEDSIAASWVGDGGSATVDFHHALTFASVYRAPVILNVVNNQWAITSFQGIAGGEQTTFAARAIGHGLPGLRVDGNDFLAVHAATRWAEQRARAGLGATLIEHYTYRGEAHSTSDDPSRYRPADEPEKWPLGDPIERLKQHLIALGEWDQARHDALKHELAARLREAGKEAESIGTIGQSRPEIATMFEDVFKEPDWRLLGQRRELGV
jgi:2-oxoisovalerate dehydrogenase E1 component alpha subunit